MSAASLCAAARLGSFACRDGKRSVDYPACMLPTVRGLVSHLTKDNADVLPFEAVCIPLESLYAAMRLLMPASRFDSDLFLLHRRTIDEAFHFESAAKFCFFAQPAASLLRCDGKQELSLHSARGVKRISIGSFYGDTLAAAKPDAVQALAAYNGRERSENGKAKAWQRTLSHYEELLATAAQKELGYGLFFPVLYESSSNFMAVQAAFFESQAGSAAAGFVIDGCSVDEVRSLLRQPPLSTSKKPIVVLGLYTPEEVLGFVGLGASLFEAKFAEQLTAQGRAIIFGGDDGLAYRIVNLLDAAYEKDCGRLAADCGCMACSSQLLCYLHHLLSVKEMLGSSLLAHHNLLQYANFFAAIRKAAAAAAP